MDNPQTDMEKARKVSDCECNTYTKDCKHILNIAAALREARREGLEEAAKITDRMYYKPAYKIAEAIRAAKERDNGNGRVC
jgi:aspartate aminotransferase-like enzyme